VCDVCGGELYQREDDRPEVVSERIKVYLRETAPVIEYYRNHGVLREVDGTRDIDDVADDIQRQLEATV
jgi:adenylate kinase